MNFTTRIAKIKDSQSIAELSRQLGYPSKSEDISKRITEIINNQNHCVFVTLNNEQIVGWIHGVYSLRVESDPFVEIGGLVVDENYRYNGIGKMLVENIITWSESKNCKKIRVRCNIIRKEAHVFYEKIGFELNKEQKVFDKRLITPGAP